MLAVQALTLERFLRLQCPEGMTRKSRSRYHGEFKPGTGQRLRSLARDVLPPIIARQLKKLS